MPAGNPASPGGVYMGNTSETGGEPVRIDSQKGLFKVSPYMVIPSRVGGFSLYLKQDETFVLYAERGELFTDAHKARLGKLGVDHLYVRAEDYTHYASYLQDNLLELLYDEKVPVLERARAWNDATVALAKEAFDRNLPRSMDRRRFKKIRKLVNDSMKFLAREDALKELARFFEDGNEVYKHGISVLVLTISMLSKIVEDDNELLVAVGMGALLHDIGKLELPPDLFKKAPSTLSRDERDLVRSHPALGVGVCSSMPLPQETLQCILFHHERMDGSGYPSGGSADLLPFYVKALNICNEYDNLIRGQTESRKRHSPFEALNRIKGWRGAHDPEMLIMLIEILSRADIA